MLDILELDKQIEKTRRQIRTDRLNISYHELASMYEYEELTIAPKYQRLFRWTDTQKSRFIESVLLRFPVPAIFVVQTGLGLWEVMDGMQRLTTIFEFMGVLKNPEGQPIPPFRLSFSEGETRLLLLNKQCFAELSLRTRLFIQRATCHVEIFKVGEDTQLKHQLFERFNPKVQYT